MCGRNLREGRRTHSGQQELEGTSNDLGGHRVILAGVKACVGHSPLASNWTISVEPVNLDVANTQKASPSYLFYFHQFSLPPFLSLLPLPLLLLLS